MITLFTGNILRYLEDNDFPVATFIITSFGGNIETLDKVVVDMAKKGIPKEQIISALVAYENKAVLPLTKKFKLDVKSLQKQSEENSNYSLLVSPLSSFTG